MKKPNLINERIGLKINPLLVEKERIRNFENKLSEDLAEKINATEDDGCVWNNRMTTLAQALFMSETLSVFDEDYELDKLLNEIYALKIKAHLNAFEASFKVLKEEKYDKVDSSFYSNGLSVFIKEIKNEKMDCRIIFIEDFENKEPIIAFAVFYSENIISNVKAMIFPTLMISNDELIKKKINNRKDSDNFFCLKNANQREGSHMSIHSLDGTKKSLGLINRVSSCLGGEVDFSF